ncbi:hypothetical protein C487_13894 [Natrinema pallidum DSM 3751]|uniref:Uncharacterized protein n=2 Tax=Natrinema pallidum TaxID=69527 RepID=L9YPA0_9EURY|nr:hypothetical protein C487_13894 [Natrinema pallidum DSM 3751]QCW05022.1 hypothetical protein FGF80_14450 [Natrinema pallidum]
MGVAGISGVVAADESSEDEESVKPTGTESFAIRFETEPDDGTLTYEVTVPDEDATLNNVENGILGNDDVTRNNGETTVEGTVKGQSPYYDEIQFDTEDGNRPAGDEWWKADAGLQVELDTPAGSEILQEG